MKLRSRKHPSPISLLLFSSLAIAASSDSKPGSVQHLQFKQDLPNKKPDLAAAPDARPEVGTKDAPVDGLDGKPHAGPFVDSTKKKNPQQVEDIPSNSGAISKENKEKVLGDTFATPEDDGVMSDVSDRRQPTGPTGTEGGVTQKDREKKEKGGAGQEKRPEAPKEAPKLKDFEEERKKTVEQEVSEKKKGAAGLEVSSIRVHS
jgi:hypothetical protein